MSAQTIRTALGLLQDDPDLENAWNDLQDAVTAPDPGMPADELTKLLDAAKRAHENRREWEAVARLLELVVVLRDGQPDEADKQAELAHVLAEELFDDKQAVSAYKRLLQLRPGDPAATQALEDADVKRAERDEIVARYGEQAEAASDPAFKATLHVRAAETRLRFAGLDDAEALRHLEQALQVDPKNARAPQLLERIHEKAGRYEDAARVLERVGETAATKEERATALTRLGRLSRSKLKDAARAAAAYERALDLSPGNGEAMSALAEHFSATEQWEHLAALYEDQLRGGAVKPGQEAGMVFQIAMVHWRMRGKPEAAEPWFDRLRRVEPAHPGMLAFFREQLPLRKDNAKLLSVLSEAQRALPDGEARAQIASEIAKLAEGEANAAKAIEQYKAVLRQDPGNREARSALRRLYTQTEAWNALVELLRQELERTPAEDTQGRLGVLRDIADVYKSHVKSDTALVTVLTQIVQLDDKDVAAVRELVRVHESLSRFRDLLTYQQKLADLIDDPGQKADLYRAVARRWLEQFSNVQNAVDAYESLLEVANDDEEARSKLRELYTKRRAFPQLYALYETELAGASGAARVEILGEMAKLAAERLDRGADAIRLYKEALAVEEAPAILDALEKQAEREKDYATVAEVLERRVARANDDPTRLTILSRLGAVYAERLNDPAGAARAWRRVLEIQPGHPKALRTLRDAYLAQNDLESLEQLYASQNDWEGLADVLSQAADKAPDPVQKVTLARRTARVFEENLKTPDRAFRAYERILSVRPDDAEAAAALVPIYEREERWPRLISLYEILLGHAPDQAERVALYRKLENVAGRRLGDRAAALTYARKAFDIAEGGDGTLELLENASRAASSWDVFVDALRSRLALPNLPEHEQRLLKARLAEVQAIEQGNVEQAVVTYRALVEENPNDEEVVGTLDRLLRGAGLRDDLRWLFELRAKHTASDEAKAKLLAEWAALEEEVFGEPQRAIELYRRVLAIDPAEASSLSALARLLLAAGDAAGAAEVMATRRDLAAGETRGARELDLAELYLDQLARPVDALEAAVRALELLPHDPRAISALERLQSMQPTKARAADVLQAEYGSTGNARLEARSLGVLLDATTDGVARLDLYVRLADVQEKKLSSAGAALDWILRAASEHPTELPLWDRAQDLANLAGRPVDLAEALATTLMRELPEEVEIELCERAAQLRDEKLGDAEGAVPYLDRVLTRQPTNERAFQRLRQILTATERWAQLEMLYERVVAATTDDAKKGELLAEVALVCEEITGENAKAIDYYERILAIDPLYEQAIRALDGLYVTEKRPQALAKLLERRLETATDAETVEIKLRLGRIYLDDLHDPPTALANLEEVLGREVGNLDAQKLVERLLEVASLRARAAALLETVYEAKDEVRDLVRVLVVRLEETRDEDARRELLRRIATLRDQRLADDAGAFEALAELVPLDPVDVASRERLRDIGRRLGLHERVAVVLERAAAAAATNIEKGEILMEAARIHEDFLADPNRAEEVYRRVVALDPSDAALVLPAARALERLAAAGGKNAELAEMLELQVRLEENGDTKRELLSRLGELQETVLGDQGRAIAAYRARLDDEPGDERTLAALERLYERGGRHRELVEVLRAREQVTPDPNERRRLLVKSAETLAGPLGDVTEAINVWQTVRDEFGPDRATLAALAALYERSKSYGDLAQTLEQDLNLADEPSARIALFSRLGDVRRQHLDDLAGALEAYREALTLEPAHAQSRAALELLLDVNDARREAASILHPLYEADGDHARLLHVLEIEAETTDLPPERLSVLEKAVRVAEIDLGDAARAFGYAKRGLRESAAEATFPDWLSRVESLAAKTEKPGELADVLAEVAKDILDEQQQLAVTRRVADLARKDLGDRERAKEWYRRALSLRDDDRHALTSLEQIFGEQGDAPSLLEILKRRVEVAESEDEKRDLLYREAKLTEGELADKTAAIGVYEQILDLSLDPPAIDALERLYEATSRFDDLVSLYQRQIDARPANEAALHVKLARVAESRLADVDRAFDELEAALRIDPQEGSAIETLEGLLENASSDDDKARAAQMLEPVYLRRSEWKKVMRTIEARLAANDDPDERRALLRRLAKLHEEQEENYKAALETTAKLLHEDLADTSTWDELERLAKVASASQRLAEIYAGELARVDVDEPHTAQLARRTGEIRAELGHTDDALKFYRRALAYEPESREIFQAIDTLLVNARRPGERAELYRAALDHRHEPADKLAALHVIADLEENALAQPEKAIDTYRAALDEEPTDAVALDALTRLYRAHQRFRDLADLYLRRIDGETDMDAVASHRLALSRLYRNELADISAGIDQLESIVAEAPWHKEAIADLERLSEDPAQKARVVEILRPLYERADDWRDIVRLNDQRLSLATDPSEKIAILRETAQLYEQRAGEKEQAFAKIREAFALDPEDGETRAELDRLATALNAWNALAQSYETGIVEAQDQTKRELLMALAKVHDERRDDPRQALAAYERLAALDETDLEPLDAMDGLSLLLSDWETHVRVLARKAELQPSDEDRASTYRRIGEAKRDLLGDEAGAIEAYERALDLDQTHVFTVDQLIDLLEPRGDAVRLVELYRRRVELADAEEDDLKFQLLTRIAEAHEKKLSSVRDAIDALREALEVKPADPATLQTLDRLFRAEEMWPDLLENLRLQAASATSTEDRVRLRRSIGDLHREKLDDPTEALEAYRTVLDESRTDEATITAVKGIGEAREELRLVAADILEPVLRETGRFADVAEILELRLRGQTDPEDRARTLRGIALVLEINLERRKDAQAALLRALTDTPEDAGLHDEIVRLATATQGFSTYADVLAERAAATLDGVVATDLFTRLAAVAEHELKDDARAIAAYRSALDHAGDTPELLRSLDRLYERTGDDRALADILERRIATAESDDERAELLYRLGKLQIDKFDDASAGLGTLRTCLDAKPDHAGAQAALEELTKRPELFAEAAEILEGVYRARNENEKLVNLLERRVTSVPSDERMRARLDLARVLEEQVHDAARAQRVLEEALADAPTDVDVLAEIERLAPITDGWTKATEAFDKAIANAKGLPADATRDLYMRLAEWQKQKRNDPRAAEEALEKAHALDPESLDILRLLEDLRREPGRERALVETLRRRAKLETDLDQKREILREAKQFAESAVGDVALAEEVLRQLLTENEADAWALAELTRLREAAGDAKEATSLLLRSADVAETGEEIARLKHRAADLRRNQLNDVPGAIELYADLLDQDATDEVAATALRDLYAKANRTKDLASLLERLIDVATSPQGRTALRLELAALMGGPLDRAEDAVELYRAVLDEEPGHADAVVALSQLYEKTGKDDELAELLAAQIEVARERRDQNAELAFQVRLGEIYESRLKQPQKAVETYREVLTRLPDHKGALSALARIHEARGEGKDAAEALEKLLGLEHGEALLGVVTRLSDIYAKDKNDADNRRVLERGLAEDKANASVRDRLRKLYEQTADWQKLADLLVGDAEAESVPVNKVRLLRQAADLHLSKRQDPTSAASVLEKAAELAPEDRDVLLALCDAYSESGRANEAIVALEKIIASYGGKRSKDLALIHHRVAKAHLAAGNKPKALEGLDAAFKIDPGSVAVLRDLGVLTLELGDLDRAGKAFRSLLLQKLDAGAPITKGEVFFYLGDISNRLGEKPKAIQMLERAVENDANLQKAKDLLAELKK